MMKKFLLTILVLCMVACIASPCLATKGHKKAKVVKKAIVKVVVPLPLMGCVHAPVKSPTTTLLFAAGPLSEL